MMPAIAHPKPLRADIQALRGLAVLAVLVYHLDPRIIPAGYLGVDIFFVVSGFLIASLIVREMDAGTFRFSHFYFRRAKRLLPAAYATFLLVALVAPWIVGEWELAGLARQTRAAVTFTANHYFLRQSGYFADASDRLPLLHTWSLSVEEQFYFVLPLLLLLLPISRRRHWLILLCGTSLLVCLSSPFSADARFYLLATRAWELLIGVIGALLVSGVPGKQGLRDARVIRWAFPVAIVAVSVVPFVQMSSPHPGGQALMICLATLVVILRNHDAGFHPAPIRGLAWVGDMSYSLYLVHWPIIALLKASWLGDTGEFPLVLRLAAAVLSISAGYLLYRFVERPIHRANITPTVPVVTGALAVSVALVLIGPFTQRLTATQQDFRRARMINYGLSNVCDYSDVFSPLTDCRTDDAPNTVVWGDSFAMHLVPGLASGRDGMSLIQATRSSCGPLLGAAAFRTRHTGSGSVYDRAWAASCLKFNESVLAYVASEPGISTVILASSLASYVDPDWSLMILTDGGTVQVVDASTSLAARYLSYTVRELQALGKRVLVVAPPPAAGFNPAACQERRLKGQLILGAPRDCEIPVAEYHSHRSQVIALVDSLRAAGIPLLNLVEHLCDNRRCRTIVDGTILYRDPIHLSRAGSEALSREMGWTQQVAVLAR